ncbi:MAG TPA: hypothetical protein VMI12_10315 [Puia sp.]|nr:hypothetical protein [Puia sp.]
MNTNQQIISYLENEWSLQINKHFTIEELTDKLSEEIHFLIQHDFNKLIRLLYTVDVNESKLKSLLKEKQDEDAGKLIASLIIERQIQKMQTRKDFKSKNEESGEERW